MRSDPKPEFLEPAQADEFLPSISPWTTLGGLVLLFGFGIAIVLASTLKYKITIKAPATIRPAGELRIVQSAVEGTVKKIEVKANQVVEKGAVIAQIDDSRWQTQKNQLQGDIEQAERQLKQLDAQIQSLDKQIGAERDRTNRAVSAAEAELIRSQSELEQKQIGAETDIIEAEGNLRQTHEELQKAQAQLKSAEANLRLIEASLYAAQSKRDRYEPLVEVGAISRQQFEETQLEVEQQHRSLESQTALLDVQERAIAQQQQAMEVAEARLQRTLAAQNPTDASIAIARERIAQERASGEATIARLNQEREALIQQQVEIQNQLDRNIQELAQLEINLQDTAIRTPASGTIQQLNLRNPDQVVRPSDAIATIAPSDAPLAIQAFVASREIAKVETGQTAFVRIEACPYPNYGTLRGIISAISPDTIAPEGDREVSNAIARHPQSTTGFYQVTIEPQSYKLSVRGNECEIQSGMEGTADIISTEETVLTYILRKARLLTDF